MEARYQNRFSQNMTVHCINYGHSSIGGLLRSALRNVKFGVQGIQLKCVVMIWARRCAWSHISIGSKTYLPATVRQLTLCNTFFKAR